MDGKVWMLAQLSNDQIDKLKEGERTLSKTSMTILAYQPGGLKVANLNASQVECLQGLEKQLGVSLIAYDRAGG